MGNVLGFSLLLRDRKALLRLEQRTLAPGIRLADYEAEIPDVQFPLRTQGAAAFRRRRCHARQMRLEVQPRALRAWLHTRLVGQAVGGLQVDAVEVELWHDDGAGGPASPHLFIRGRRQGRTQWLMFAVQLWPRGRRLSVRPWRVWQMGEDAPPADAVWRDVCGRLGGTVDPEDAATVWLDPVRAAVLRPFVVAGWRPPDLTGLVLEGLVLSPDRGALSVVRRNEGPGASPVPPLPLPTEDPVADALARVHAALRDGERATATAQLERIADGLPPEHPARFAALHWLVALSRRRDPAQHLRALRSWLHGRPRDEAAGRALVVALHSSHRALAQRLAAQCRLPHPPLRQARLELALATVLVDHLDEHEHARPVLESLVERAAEQTDLARIERPARATLARALAERPALALSALSSALALAERSVTRASLQAGVAAALDRKGHHQAARPLWFDAIAIAPDDAALVDDALDSAQRSGDATAVVDLLRAAVPHADPQRALALRQTLVASLRERGDATSRALALAELRALVREYPEARELALELSTLEHDEGRSDRAASLLDELATASEDAEDRVRLRLEQARLLIADQQPRRAWAKLEPVIEQAPAPMLAEVLELALSVAPLSVRDGLLDRLVELDAGPRSGRALLARAEGRGSPSKRKADLELAAARLDDPSPALHQLAQLAATDEVEPWAALAEALSAVGERRAEGEAQLELALRQLHHDRLDAATTAMDRALQLRSDDTALRLAVGWVHARNEHFSAAAHHLEALEPEALALDRPPLSDPRLGLPGDATTITGHIGMVLLRAGRPADAITRLRPAVARLGAAAQPELARALVEAIEAEGHDEQAATVARTVADAHAGDQRAQWLARAAAHARPTDAVAWLTEAVELDPTNGDRVAALQEAARAAGDEATLTAALQRTAGHEGLPAGERARALRELLSRHEHHDDGAPEDEESIGLYERLLAVDAHDANALLALAARAHRDDDVTRAHELWTRALEELPAHDPRRTGPALVLARHQLASGRAPQAAAHLSAVLEHDGTHLEALTLLADVSLIVDDPALRLRALEGMVEHSEPGPALLHARQALAQHLGSTGHPARALPHAAAASQGLDHGTAAQLEATRQWLALAEAVGDARQQAAAREQLRLGLGPELSAKELRTEALLLAEQLGEHAKALALVGRGLHARPTDGLLLSTFKQLVVTTGDPMPYLLALEAAVESAGPGSDRDRLATELALSAAEVGDAARAHRALGRLSVEAGDGEELLDLRIWVVHALGLQDEELRQIDQRLREGPLDEALLHRLARLLGDGEPTVEHLLAVARDSEPDVAGRLVEPALVLAEPLQLPSLSMRVLRHAVRVGAVQAAATAWPALLAEVAANGSDATVADLVALADDARRHGMNPSPTVDRLLDESLARQPGSGHLHRALTRHLSQRGSDEHRNTAAQREAELIAHLDAIADRYELSGYDRAELFVGMTEPLDRRTATDRLAARAHQAVDDAETFGRLLQALEARQGWPEVLRLLDRRAKTAPHAEDKVATLKHLAHVAAEVLGDPPAAVRHLEAALALAPTDPDLLLPLLDHHFAQTDLRRAVELTERVLDHVRMGDAAFATLAHRAADAAIAQGDAERAQALLLRVTARIPADEKALARLAELESRRDDPARRVELLAAVAARQGGKARIEALEERARLLLDPLDRPDDAIEDLTAVVAEAPDREASAELLANLLRTHQRYPELIAFHESELPRRHGLARARTLQEIANIHRDALCDSVRAEQALRLAIEELGSTPDEQALADILRADLVANLEQQGRYVDLTVYLDAELAEQLSPDAPLEPPPEPRLDLARTLARVLRAHLDDEARAARVYEHLERWDALPDEGLATLARWYQRSRRHEDLVRVLQLRSVALGEHPERRAAVDRRVAELLDGPLSRPQDAARYYLDAYLVDPEVHAAAGARARVLLSGVDSVVNVRTRLLRRLEDLTPRHRPILLTLLADVLAPQSEYEREAESRYREALELDPEFATAHDGLGRLLSRQQRRTEASQVLVLAADSHALPAPRAADAAALAARNLIELDRYTEAEAVLKRSLARSPDSQRGLLELARLYEDGDRRGELSAVLDTLAQLPLSNVMLAEVAYRRALLLQPIYDVVPSGPQGERARSHLLEALGADPRHAAGRQALLSLATARREWSIVAHMHYLAIRELPPGPQRALVHLDLAATYLEHLGDPQSGMRNIESALQQAATDVVVANRTADLARRMPDRPGAAERFESIAAGDNELDDPARARLWLLAADLRMEDDDHDAAEAASRRVLDLPKVPHDATAAATRTLQRLGPRDAASLTAASSGVLARLDGQPPPRPTERAELLGRLHDLGVDLDDPGMVERASREQVAMAADLDESDAQAITTSALLRDLLTARGEYGPVVELYERLASQAGREDPGRAAAVLVEAAGFAWRGQGDPTQAATLLGRALQLCPTDDAATRLLAELSHATTDAEQASAIAQGLGTVPEHERPPLLRLQLASLAITLGDDDGALTQLRPLVDPSIVEPVRFEALGRLESVLAARGDQGERRDVLHDYFAAARDRNDPRAGDLGLELAQLQQADGDTSLARNTAEAARVLAPDHRPLLRLLAELAELEEDWRSLVELFEELAQLALDDTDQAMWLTRAGRTHLAQPQLTAEGDGAQVARRLLLRAREVAPTSPEPRVALLPLSFSQARWDEVLELAEELIRHVGNDEDVLVLAAIAEAYRRGGRRLAVDIGYRHPPAVARRWLLPGLQQALGEVAMRGPLPRLDALLAAGSALLGGRRHLFESMHGWASERPPHAGLALGLARLYEARGTGDMARLLYQLAAFVAPRGPVPALVARLPRARMDDPDLHRASTAPMEGRTALREVLVALRDHLSGLGQQGAPTLAPPHARSPGWWHTRMELAETIVEPWRALLGVDLPLAWTEDPVEGGVAVRNDRPPRLVLGRVSATLSVPELTFRLGYATATVALGMAALAGPGLDLAVLLDALGQLGNPGHQPTGQQAQALADVLAAREARMIGLSAGRRTGLVDELAHWLTTEGGLERLHSTLHRARLLLGTRLCGQLGGTLQAIARDHGLVRDGRIETTTALQLPDAMWLLRALSLR
ncbi:MAG: hypothetical protein K0V04_32360 [Deltaproteobacteria bacterium]|nr:hypothetical protein [Deltaproteobacteria bacterium]